MLRIALARLVAFPLILSLVGCGQAAKTPSGAGNLPPIAARPPSIVGTWEATENQDKVTLNFAADGKLQLTGKAELLAFAFQFAKIMGGFSVQPESVPLTYKLEGEKLEIEADLTKLVEALGGDAKNAKPRESAQVALGADELTITSSDGKKLTLKRVK